MFPLHSNACCNCPIGITWMYCAQWEAPEYGAARSAWRWRAAATTSCCPCARCSTAPSPSTSARRALPGAQCPTDVTYVVKNNTKWFCTRIIDRDARNDATGARARTRIPKVVCAVTAVGPWPPAGSLLREGTRGTITPRPAGSARGRDASPRDRSGLNPYL